MKKVLWALLWAAIWAPVHAGYIIVEDGGGGSSGLTDGTTPITGGATGEMLYNNGGVVDGAAKITTNGSTMTITGTTFDVPPLVLRNSLSTSNFGVWASSGSSSSILNFGSSNGLSIYMQLKAQSSSELDFIGTSGIGNIRADDAFITDATSGLAFYSSNDPSDTGYGFGGANILDLYAGGIMGRFTTTGLFVGGSTSPGSTLHSGGSVQFPLTIAATPATLGVSDMGYGLTSSSGTINLPSATSITGRQYQVFHHTNSTQTVVVDASGSQTINGQLTYRLREPFESVTVSARLASAGETDWNVISGKPYQYKVSTTDTTATTIATLAVLTDEVHTIEAFVTGIKDDESQAAGYVIAGTFRNAAGTITQVGTTTAVHTVEDDASWAAAFTVSGTNVLVQVTGNTGDNVAWTSEIKRVVAP